MIRLLLSGGLGNQMFQFAAAKSLSLKTSLELSIDTQLLEKKTKATKRDYDLDIFKIENIIGTKLSDKIFIRGFLILNKINISADKLFDIFKDEKAQIFDKRFSSIDKSILLYGYFQNENYFKDISDQLRVCFSFKAPLNGKNEELNILIQNNNAVSIHIRRCDYLSQNSNQNVLELEYYKKAVRFIASKIDNPYFIIFSDDMTWVKNNLELGYNHLYVDWNQGKESYIDMQLMSLCKHNIIANSTFSWWGAWLNKNIDKLVVAPNKWYKKDTSDNYPDGFVPNGWNIL